MIKYLFLYQNGGIYVDLDYECIRNFYADISDMGKDLFFVASSNIIDGGCHNSLLISKPKISFWLVLVDEVILKKLLLIYVTSQ